MVIGELCQVAYGAKALYLSEDWEFVRGSMSRESRAEAAGALRAVAYVAQSMAESLEKGNVGEEEPPTNYGVQR